jgi:F-type H+-transporting ATPase subunit alpha
VRGYLDNIAVKDVQRFEKGLLQHLRSNCADMLEYLRKNDGKVAGELEDKIKGAVEGFAKTFA